MALEERGLERLERALDRVGLLDDVDAVLVVLDHLADALQVALDGGEAIQDLLLVGLHVVCSHPPGEGVSHTAYALRLAADKPTPRGRGYPVQARAERSRYTVNVVNLTLVTCTMETMRRRWRWLPPETTPDAAVLIAARGVRAFGDGFVSVLLPVYLLGLGFDGLQIGGVATATLVGSAALTLVVGLIAHRFEVRRLLVGAAMLMAATGVGFALVHDFWPLLVVAFVGTLNPSSGDVSVFLPLEQTLLPQTVSARERTALFARYSLVGSLLAAVGALLRGSPRLLLVSRTALPAVCRAAGNVPAVRTPRADLARALQPPSPAIGADPPARAPLRESRRIVYTLAALFSLDSFGGGFVVQSLLALWLFQRFDLSVATAGHDLLLDGRAVGRVVPRRRSARQAHRPAQHDGVHPSAVQRAADPRPFMPNLPLAILLLLARSALSQMDVPTRNSYVMAVVPPAERPAAASVTSVPRSLAHRGQPAALGLSARLCRPSAGRWSIGGVLKGVYDLLLLAMFAG